MESQAAYSLDILSNELLCHILKYLPLKQVLLLGTLSKSLYHAVELHLSLIKKLDFGEEKILGFMPSGMTDKHLSILLKKCPRVEVIRGFHPFKVNRSRLRKANGMSVPGILDALSCCPNLKQIEISSVRLLETFTQHLPHVEIYGHFRNRDGHFPWEHMQQVKLSPFLRLNSLHLIGVQVPELVGMNELQHLYLQWVTFTRLYPFRSFSAKKLSSFVMRQCIGPAFPLRYYPLFIALGYAQDLSRLEIICIPVLGGMIARSVEEAGRHNGFRKISKLIVAGCKGIMESDLGQLMIACSQSLETLYVQSSLTKDSLFASLHFVGCNFSHVKTLYLGYIDRYPARGECPEETYLAFCMTDTLVLPASLSDGGINTVSQLFPSVQELTISNCHHIINPRTWNRENIMWNSVKSLVVERCHCLLVLPLAQFINSLNKLEVLVLKNLFREYPKGCSYVGLSAGTGLGLSSAIVSTRYEHIAVVVRDSGDDENPENGEQVGQEEGEESRAQLRRGRRRNMAIQRNSSVNAEQGVEAVPGCSHHSQRDRRSTRNKMSPKKKKSSQEPKAKSKSAVCKPPAKKRTRKSPNKKADGASAPDCNSYSGPYTRHQARVASGNKSPASRDTDEESDSESKRKKPSSASKKDAGSPKKEEPVNSKKLPESYSISSDEEEPDVVMIFHVASKSLLSFTVITCGLTDLEFGHCPSLSHVEVQDCRIMKNFHFTKCEALQRINAIQCPKLYVSKFVPEVLKVHSKSPLIVYMMPTIQNYNQRAMVNAVMYHAANVHRSLYVLHHYCDLAADSTEFRTNFLSWMQDVQLYMSTKCSTHFLNKIAPIRWGYQLHKLHGLSCWGNYELLTNNGDFIDFWQSQNIEKTEFFQGPASYDNVLPESLKLSGPNPSGKDFFIGKNQVAFFIDVKT